MRDCFITRVSVAVTCSMKKQEGVKLLTANICTALLHVSILGLPSNELSIVQVKAAILSKSRPSLEQVSAVLGIDEKRFRWVCAGHTGDYLIIGYRSLTDLYSVTI